MQQICLPSIENPARQAVDSKGRKQGVKRAIMFGGSLMPVIRG